MILLSSCRRFVTTKRHYLFAIFLALLLYNFSLIPVFAPGIDQPSAIGPYLNGVFPSEASNEAGQNWELENVYPNLTFPDPMALLELPDQKSYYLVSKLGFIFQLSDDGSSSSVDTVLNITNQVNTGVDNGISNAVLHPEFGQADSPNRGYVYLYYRYHPNGSQVNCNADAFLRLSRFNRPDGSAEFDPNSELVLIQTFDEQCYHSGGALFFDQEGYLYLATGDAGGSGDEFQVTQRINERLMSGLLRIDVDMDITRSHPIRRQQLDPAYMSFTSESSFQQGYYIPNDNPFVDDSGANLEEFYAIGLRAPHRGAIDELTGEIWIGDVGEGSREEISIVPKGGNMQWPFMEGFSSGSNLPDPLIGISTPPIYDYDHSEGNAIIGGFVYRGNHYQGALNGQYIFGDHGTRKIWSYNPINEEVKLLTTAPDFGAGDNKGISSFATNAAGEIFVLKLYGTDQDGGVIYKLNLISDLPEPPPLLSQTGAFTDLVNLSPAPGLVPYTVNSPLWSDRAVKKQWIALPNDGTHDTAEEQITFSATSNWQFPAGTVFIKHFELPVDYNNPSVTKRLETRFFVLADDGEAYGVTYKWNDEGTDATLLVNSETKDFAVTFADGSNGVQTWNYPSRADCMTCHTTNAGSVLGIHTWQLNGDLTYPSGITDNQLNTWLQLGMFANPFTPSEISGFLQASNISDSSASLEERVRSYLDSNCSSCHRPNGVDGAFDARFSTPLEDQHILWTYGLSRNTPANHYMIKPLDTDRSAIWIRDGKTGTNAMPPLAKKLVDEEYMAVLTDWINSLVDESCTELNVSALEWIQAENTNGPVEIDQSNGEGSIGDGSPITINGQVFPKGLGVHAPSEITYATYGDFAVFQSFVGIDDEVASCGGASMQFEVYANDILVAQSPVMRAGDNPYLLTAEIEGATEVKLVATVGGDNESCDHGDWAAPKFLSCGDCEPNTPCNDGDACTVDDQYDNNCQCVGTFTDTDEDGVSDVCDVCPGFDDTVDTNNNGIPDGCDECIVLAGQVCDDGDACTVDDQYDNNCQCVGTFTDTDEDGVSDVCDVCPGFDDTVDTNNNGIPDGCDECIVLVGQVCDDGDACTVDDQYDNNCQCIGTFTDTDEDGVSDVCDVCPGFDDTEDTNNNGIPDGCDECIVLAGQTCDDGDACTVDDQYDNNCQCIGTFTDTDEDGVSDVCDVCPGSDDRLDIDNDGVPDDCDQCYGYDDSVDTDGDGVSDGCDQCPGFDDKLDTDNDNIPDHCDHCIGRHGLGCPDGDCLIDASPLPTDIYSSDQRLRSISRILAESTVVFQAGNSIELKPGFTVEAGASFHAAIVECEEPLTNTLLALDKQVVPDFGNSLQDQESRLQNNLISPSGKKPYKDQINELSVKVRPNPFDNEFRLTIKAPFPELKRALIRIMDINGRVMYQKNDAPFNEEIQIQTLQGWANGIYILHVHASGYSFSQTIVKQ